MESEVINKELSNHVATMGHLIGTVRRKKQRASGKYIMLPLDAAEAIHAYMKDIKYKEYQKWYRKI